MTLWHLYRHSLKARVTLLTLLIFVLGFWSLALYAERMLHRDMRAQLESQQFSTVSLLASEVDQELRSRLTALAKVAATIDTERLANPPALQQLLADRPLLLDMFNGGVYVTDARGTVHGSLPESAQRHGLNFLDRDYIQTTLRDNRPTIGKPVMGRQLQSPIIGMGVPIRDARQGVIGVLAGVINLGTPNFLDRFGNNQYATTGNYLLVDAAHRLIVTGTAKSRTLEVLPAPGVSPVLDRFIDGLEGSEVFVNPIGQNVLASVKRISVANWYAAVALPTDEAFAPIRSLQQRILLASLLLTLLVGGLSWWLLSRQLAPLQAMAHRLTDLTEQQQEPLPLPPDRDDELGQVITAFNRLLADLSQRQTVLRDSEERYRIAFQTSPDALSISRLADGRYLDVNDGFVRLSGWPREAIIGKTSIELGIWRRPEDRTRFLQALKSQDHVEQIEFEFVNHSGAMVPTQVSASRISLGGEACVLLVSRDISERRQTMTQIEQLAFADPLTGLPNRRLLKDRLKHALTICARTQHHGALMFIDLDHFKTLNDTLGHDIGDQLLQQLAVRLLACVRQEDTVARLGGDEFVVLLENLSPQRDQAAVEAEVVAQKVLDAIKQPSLFGTYEHHGSASIGITLFGETIESTTEPLKRADLAMYQAKSAGRNTLRFFDPAMQSMISQRVALEASLREALHEQRFVLHYQLQVGQATEVIGVEALVRWQDPQRGLILPGEFIALSEETGLIVPLGRWVIETACAQLARWASQPELARLTMAINVSARQFRQDNFVSHIERVLADTGAPASRLKLELTESLLVTHMDEMVAKMDALRAIGVRFSLDDFGTGFSSLAYLKRMPLDQLKIDQGFVRDILIDPNDAAIAGMVVALGNSLGLSVMAEGVETEDQRAALASLGCTSYQGYLFGRPLPIDALEAFLRHNPPKLPATL